MAVQFASSQRRSFWAAMIVSSAIDYLAVLAVLWFLGVTQDRYLYAALWTVGIWVGMSMYGLLGVAKRLAWYFLFEKSARVDITVREISDLGLPAPSPYYNDADQYLLEVAQSPDVSDAGRLWAGMLLGSITSQRMVGPRMEALLTAITVEAALKLLGQRQRR